MNYYSIHKAVRKIGRGGFPQSQSVELEAGRTVDDPDFIWKLRPDRFPDIEPYTGTLILKDGATRTDFISSVTVSFAEVCNERVAAILEDFDLGETRFYPTRIKHKGIVYDNYQLLHSINNYSDRIDFYRSDFRQVRIVNNERVGERCYLNSFEEFKLLDKKFREADTNDWSKLETFAIVFKDQFNPPSDIFNLSGIISRTFISERLKNAFDAAGITGIGYDFDGCHIDFSC